jgi:hypothetical protein
VKRDTDTPPRRSGYEIQSHRAVCLGVVNPYKMRRRQGARRDRCAALAAPLRADEAGPEGPRRFAQHALPPLAGLGLRVHASEPVHEGKLAQFVRSLDNLD